MAKAVSNKRRIRRPKPKMGLQPDIYSVQQSIYMKDSF
jgi:hypothetical protein